MEKRKKRIHEQETIDPSGTSNKKFHKSPDTFTTKKGMEDAMLIDEIQSTTDNSNVSKLYKFFASNQQPNVKISSELIDNFSSPYDIYLSKTRDIFCN